MDFVPRVSFRHPATRCVAIAAVVCVCAPASAQPWLPPAVGSITIGVQHITNTGHLLTDGSKVDGSSLSVSLFIDADYAITDRLVVSPVCLTSGPNGRTRRRRPFVHFLPVDQCHCWHAGLQDFVLSGGTTS